MGSLRFEILPPPEALRKDIECIRIATYTGDEVAIKVAPSALPGIVFQHDNGRSAIEAIATHSRFNPSIPTLFLYGAGIEPSIMNYAQGSYVTTQAVFKPHALNTLLGLNARVLTSGPVELGEFSGDDLGDRLMEARSDQERVAYLTDFLVAQLRQEKPRDALVEESLRLIHRHIANINVKTLLDTLNISERQFERRFSQTVGVSPHAYIRVKRFNEAVRLVKTRQFGKLMDVAYALNFYDQSHLIRDIKAFAGITPKDMAQKEDDFYHGEAGYSYV